MRIFGADIDFSIANEPFCRSELDEPLFARGDEQNGHIGCLALHGLDGTPANLGLITQACRQRGYTVSAPLLPGHGTMLKQLRCRNDIRWLEAALAGYDALAATGCTKIHVIGFSMGAVLAGLVATERQVASAVLIAPPVYMQPYLRYGRFLSPLIPYLRTEPQNRKPDPYHVCYPGAATCTLHDVARLARMLRKRIPNLTCPVLAIEGKFDKRVDKKSFAFLEEKLRRCPAYTHRLFSESGHGIPYGVERGALTDCVLSYIAGHSDALD